MGKIYLPLEFMSRKYLNVFEGQFFEKLSQTNGFVKGKEYEVTFLIKMTLLKNYLSQLWAPCKKFPGMISFEKEKLGEYFAF